MKKILLSALLLFAVVAACGQQTPTPRKAYLYCAVDTTWQSLPASVVDRTLFPDSKFHPRARPVNAIYENGVALIELELTGPASVMVMPSRDSTVKMAMSDNFLLLPGDSLELRSVPDSTIPGLKCARPALVETARKDNTCQKLLSTRFSYKTNPKAVDGNLTKYRASWDSLRMLKIALLDSCRAVMPLSDEYYQFTRAAIDADMLSSLYTGERKNKDAEKPAGYFDGLEISELLAGTSQYAYGMRNKYVKYAVAEPEKNFEAVYAGIQKAPNNLRDYLTAMAIGYYAELQLPIYEQPLTEAIAQAEKSIRDTAYLSYIARAKEFYFKRNMPFPDDALQQTMLRTTDSDTKISLADVLTKFKGFPVYIDFWASWCSGCIMDMQQSANAKKYLEDKGIVYLYFSIDEDVDSWLKASEKYNAMKNSYLCFGECDSPMTKFLGIHEIPRYILLDENHKIVSMDSPRPTDFYLNDLKRLVESMGPITFTISK